MQELKVLQWIKGVRSWVCEMIGRTEHVRRGPLAKALRPFVRVVCWVFRCPSGRSDDRRSPGAGGKGNGVETRRENPGRGIAEKKEHRDEGSGPQASSFESSCLRGVAGPARATLVWGNTPIRVVASERVDGEMMSAVFVDSGDGDMWVSGKSSLNAMGILSEVIWNLACVDDPETEAKWEKWTNPGRFGSIGSVAVNFGDRRLDLSYGRHGFEFADGVNLEAFMTDNFIEVMRGVSWAINSSEQKVKYVDRLASFVGIFGGAANGMKERAASVCLSELPAPSPGRVWNPGVNYTYRSSEDTGSVYFSASYEMLRHVANVLDLDEWNPTYSDFSKTIVDGMFADNYGLSGSVYLRTGDKLAVFVPRYVVDIYNDFDVVSVVSAKDIIVRVIRDLADRMEMVERSLP